MTSAGWLLIIGALVFNIAAFAPFNMRFFTSNSAESRAAMIERGPWMWRALCVLFMAGAVLTVAGLLLLTLDLGIWWLWIGLAAAVVGTYFWLRINLFRLAAVPQAVANNPGAARPWFRWYVLLTQAAWIIFGLALLNTTLPAWLGWGLIVVTAVTFGLYVITRDLPPFVFYLLTLVIGGVLLG